MTSAADRLDAVALLASAQWAPGEITAFLAPVPERGLTSDEIIAYEDSWWWSPTHERYIDDLIAAGIHAVEMFHERLTPQQIADDRAAERERMMAIACGVQFGREETAAEAAP